MKLAAGAAILLSAWAVQPSLAAPAFTTRYVYYNVSGDSAAGVYLSMLRRGPHVRGKRAYAATTAEFYQRGRVERKKGCRIHYQYAVDFLIRLPKLSGEGSLSPVARARWREFSSFVRRHEERHRAIWMSCAREVETKVNALRGRSCDDVEKKAQAVRARIQKACNRKHMAFDAAEQKKLATHPFVQLVLAPERPAKARTTRLASKKRRKSAALFN